jgi:hypothetical protein
MRHALCRILVKEQCHAEPGKGLVHLLGLKGLRELDLTNTQVGDVGLKAFQDLGQPKSLTELKLTRTKVTDEGLKSLQALSQLRQLDIRGNPGITDAGLENLKALKNLYHLRLSGTNVSLQGIKEFQANFENLTVEFDNQ